MAFRKHSPGYSPDTIIIIPESDLNVQLNKVFTIFRRFYTSQGSLCISLSECTRSRFIRKSIGEPAVNVLPRPLLVHPLGSIELRFGLRPRCTPGSSALLDTNSSTPTTLAPANSRTSPAAILSCRCIRIFCAVRLPTPGTRANTSAVRFPPPGGWHLPKG